MKRHSGRMWRTAPWALAAVMVLSAPLTGCGEKEQPAADAGMDLSNAGDLFSQPVRNAAPEPADGDAFATVNGKNITWGEVRREVDRAMRIAEMRQVPPEQMAQMRDKVMRQASEALIVKRLLLDEADRASVAVSPEEIEKARGEFIARFPPGMTLEEALQRQGLTAEQFEGEFATELRINKLVETQTREVAEPTDEEVSAFYEKHKDQMDVPERVTARHILIGVQPDATDEAQQAARAKAEEVRTRLVDGGDFAALAAEYSDCPSKARGGALPPFGRGDMVKPFEDAAFTQEKDAIGPVVETQFGYHIVQVSERTEAHAMTLDEVRPDLVRGMTAQKRQQAVREYVEGLKAKADIQFAGATPPAAGPLP